MSQTSKEICLTISSRLEELSKIEKLSEKIACRMALDEDEKDNLSIAVTEAVGNAIVHGNKKNPQKKVHVVFRFGRDTVRISVRDEGEGFNPNALSDPLEPDNLMKESGRGIFILKTLMDEVRYSFSPEGTTVAFVLKKKGTKT